MERGEDAAALVQEEQVDQNPWTDHAHNAAKQPAEHTRDYIAIIVARVRHLQRPDLREHAGEQCPEDDHGLAVAVGDGRKEKAAACQASLGCGALERIRWRASDERQGRISRRLTW